VLARPTQRGFGIAQLPPHFLFLQRDRDTLGVIDRSAVISGYREARHIAASVRTPAGAMQGRVCSSVGAAEVGACDLGEGCASSVARSRTRQGQPHRRSGAAPSLREQFRCADSEESIRARLDARSTRSAVYLASEGE